MKHFFTLALCVFAGTGLSAQDPSRQAAKWPLTITLFTESIGLPNFRNILKGPGLGIRIGTELYYRQKSGSQVFQNVQVGFYRHKELHNALFLTTEFGYRKFFGNAFTDVSMGGGYMRIDSALPRYERVGSGFEKMRSSFGRIMPTLGIGAGYRYKGLTMFSRYEMFGEMPFGYSGIPALPHRAVHVGTRFNLK